MTDHPPWTTSGADSLSTTVSSVNRELCFCSTSRTTRQVSAGAIGSRQSHSVRSRIKDVTKFHGATVSVRQSLKAQAVLSIVHKKVPSQSTRMKNVALIALFLGVVVVCSAQQDKYTTRYDGIDIDQILRSDRLFNNYFNCLMDKGKCTPDGRELKSK